MTEDNGRRLSTKLLARRLQISPGTIRNWRLAGTGPQYIKAPGKYGAVAYRECDVIDWERAHIVSNTSERKDPDG